MGHAPSVFDELAAGATARLIAFLLDLLVVGFLFAPLLALALGGRFVHLWAIASLEFFGYLVYFSYLEGKRGATLGKELLGLRVLEERLTPPSYWQAFVRGLARAADLALLGLPLILRADRRRLGDILSGTVVVAEGKAALKIPTPSRYASLKRIGGRAWERDRAIVEGLIQEVRERLGEGQARLADEILHRISEREGISEGEVMEKVTQLLGLDDSDWRVGVVTYGLMSGLVTFKRESLLRRSASVLRKAAELASRLEDRTEFEARARILESLDELRSRRRGPNIRSGIASALAEAPVEFRSSLPFFAIALLVLLLGVGLGVMVGSEFAQELREIFGPPGDIRVARPTLLAAAIAMNNVRVDLGVLLGAGPAVYPIILMLLTNGAVVGALAAHSMASGSVIRFLALIAPHGVGELSLFLVAAAGGFKIAWKMMFPGRDREAALRSARRAIVLPVFAALLLPVYAIIEAFVTPRLANSPKAALLVGIASAAPVYAWLLLGRRSTGGYAGEDARSASGGEAP